MVRIVGMSTSNSWAEFAAVFRSTCGAFLEHEKAKTELKGLMPEAAKEETRYPGEVIGGLDEVKTAPELLSFAAKSARWEPSEASVSDGINKSLETGT